MARYQDYLFTMIRAFKKHTQKELRKLNDTLVKHMVLGFTKPLYELAVLSYVFSKIVSKPRFLNVEYNPKLRHIEQQLQFIAQKADIIPEPELLQLFNKLTDSIVELEAEDPRYMRNLVSKGRLKVAATMYAQGVSLGLAADMSETNKQDILDYAGKTMMFDRLQEEKTIHERLKIARGLIA